MENTSTDSVKKASEQTKKSQNDKKYLTRTDQSDILKSLDKNDDKSKQDNKVLVNQIEELVQELKKLEAENEKLKEKHEHKLGISMESIQRTKEELDRARATNRFLMENAETRKNQCGKLETQNFELKMKIESLKKQFAEMTKTNVELASEVNELLKERLEFQKVVEENDRLKALVSKYNIDINTGRIISKAAMRRSQIEGKSQAKSQNQKGPKAPMTERSNRPARKDKSVRSAKSLEDIRSQAKSETAESEIPNTSMLSPRSYLSIHHNKTTKHRRS